MNESERIAAEENRIEKRKMRILCANRNLRDVSGIPTTTWHDDKHQSPDESRAMNNECVDGSGRRQAAVSGSEREREREKKHIPNAINHVFKLKGYANSHNDFAWSRLA